jgi:hypothetical protein
MKEFLKDLFDFVLEEAVTAAEYAMVAISIFIAFYIYAVYDKFGG